MQSQDLLSWLEQDFRCHPQVGTQHQGLRLQKGVYSSGDMQEYSPTGLEFHSSDKRARLLKVLLTPLISEVRVSQEAKHQE